MYVGVYYGEAYHPEHGRQERWPTEAKPMREDNLNIVRLAEFAWAKIEPVKGEYDFSWLDEAIHTLSAEGIKVVMGTPTATPPKWLMDENPDIYMKDACGRVRGFGSRRHYCSNNPVYKKLSMEIVRAMGEHYKNDTNIVAWQIDNEFGCHNTARCYCEHCLEGFKSWLKDKYRTVDKLNSEWGTVFWSQTYRSWDELILPYYTVCEGTDMANHGHNVGMLLDFYRFSSDSVVSYQKAQIDELRLCGCKQPITHNFMGHFSEIDYFCLGKDLDFVAWDNYPDHQWGSKTYEDVAMAHDLMRGVKDKNFWVMEQQSGPCGWSVLGDTPKPGQIRLWAYQSVAHGADAIVYFRWRACTFGTEEYWYGILDHDAVPRRRYREVAQTGKEMQALSDLLVGSQVVAETALVKSYDNLWSHRFQPHNKGFDYNCLLKDYYSALLLNNINADVISAEVDLSKYKLVIMPAFNLMREDIKVKMEEYVEKGGNLIITFRSGTKTWNNRMTTDTLPGCFKTLAGVEVEEFDSLNGGRQIQVSGITGQAKASIWCDILKAETAEPLFTYSSEYYCGKPAVTVNRYGKGKVYYVGCDLDKQAMSAMMRLIASESDVKPALPEPVCGVEVIKKVNNGDFFYIILNHNGDQAGIRLNECFKELLTASTVKDTLVLEPYGVAVLLK